LKFSLTLAIAVGVAFKDGPGSLLKMKVGGGKRGLRCTCCKPAVTARREAEVEDEARVSEEVVGLGGGVEDGGGGTGDEAGRSRDEDSRMLEGVGGADGGGGTTGFGKMEGIGDGSDDGEVMVVGGIGEAVGKVVEGGGGGSEAPG
jgi:hypothetical protein